MIKKILSLIISVIMLFAADISAGPGRLEKDKLDQVQRIEALETQYADGEIAPVDEQSVYDGDLKSDLESGVRFNELSFVATHNSYQTESLPEFRGIYHNLSKLTFGLVKDKKSSLDSETLTQQLSVGIRSFEMDIETKVTGNDISFVCMHSPVTDMTTNSYDFALALKEIYMWSENNPSHLPVTIIIEPKKMTLPVNDLKPFKLKYAKELDSFLRNALGEKLLTPADILGSYESFGQMRANNGWPQIKDMLGKVLVLLHDTTVTEKYIKLDKSVKTQAMFPMLRYNDRKRDCASFLLINDPDDALKHSEEIVDEYNLIMRTQADTYTNYSDERLDKALRSRAQIMSTDYPMKAGETKETRFVYFGDCKTVRRIKNHD
ncbi:MAG: hypothetical protein IJU45_08290 [Clostridia bacterium]|nr:hypothetical protein [Clostridia bacterium]